MPLSLIDERMLGLSVVTKKAGSNPEVVLDRKIGYVPETDIQSIAAGLRELIESIDLRAK